MNPDHTSLLLLAAWALAGSTAVGNCPVVMIDASRGGTLATGSTPFVRSLAEPVVATLASGTFFTNSCATFT